MSFTVMADWADWYDTDARQYKEEVLTEFVTKHPNFFAVMVASEASFIFDAAGIFYVDFFRLGSGVGSGTAKGIFEDFLRALQAVPIGEVTAVGKPLLGKFGQPVMNFLHWSGLRGKLCVPITLAQALQRTGQRLVVRLKDVIKAMGRELDSFDSVTGKGATASEARTALTELKAQFDELPGGVAQSWDDIVMYAENSDGVLVVPLKRILDGIDKLHYIFVGKTSSGVQIFDRAGAFNSLDDLSRKYGSINPVEFYQIHQGSPLFVVKNWVLDPALANVLDAAGPLGAVMTKVAMQLGFNPSMNPATIKQAFQDHVARREADYGPPTRPPEMVSLMYTHTVEGPRIEKRDWLSSIAERWYGDMLLWPILWDFNRGPDFTNQNKMYVGQRVKVPFVRDKTPAEIAAYRKRGLNWR